MSKTLYSVNGKKSYRLFMLLLIIMLSIFSYSSTSIPGSISLPNSLLKDYSNDRVFAQMINNDNLTKILVNDTWASKRDNLSIVIKLDPKVPIMDQ